MVDRSHLSHLRHLSHLHQLVSMSSFHHPGSPTRPAMFRAVMPNVLAKTGTKGAKMPKPKASLGETVGWGFKLGTFLTIKYTGAQLGSKLRTSVQSKAP